MQGGINSVSDHRTCRRAVPKRTAKSCGPGAARLAPSLRTRSQATVATERSSPGRVRISRKAIAQGMSDVLRCPVCSCAAFFIRLRTRDRGCSAHPAFPAPSLLRGKRQANLGLSVPRDRGRVSGGRNMNPGAVALVAHRWGRQPCRMVQRRWARMKGLYPTFSASHILISD